MLDTNLNRIIKLYLWILSISAIALLILMYIETKYYNVINSQKQYAESIIDNTLEVLDNPVTDKTNDFFVITTDNKSFYITVIGNDGDYSHTSVEVTKDDVQLNKMMETAIERKNAPEPKSNTTTFIPVFFHR